MFFFGLNFDTVEVIAGKMLTLKAPFSATAKI
jgi:hypothetical protein